MDLREVVRKIEGKISELERQKEEKIKEVNNKYDDEINQLKQALAVNKQMNTVCLKCGGRGFYGKLDAAGGKERQKCERCNGKGVEPE